MPITPVFKWPTFGQIETLRAVNFDWRQEFYFLPLGAELPGLVGETDLYITDHDWVIICPPSAYVAPQIKSAISKRAAERPDIDLFYADDIDLSVGEVDAAINNKPDFDATLLASTDYIGPSIIVRSRAFYRLLGNDEPRQIFNVHEFVLRACASGLIIGRIAHVLFAYPEPTPTSTRTREALAPDARFRGRRYSVLPGLTPESSEIRRVFETFPAVTILISTLEYNNRRGCEDAIDSLVETDWPPEKLKIIIDDPFGHFRQVPLDHLPFNFAKVIPSGLSDCQTGAIARLNCLWKQAETEHIAFLSDVAPLKPGWLQALLTFSCDLSVGLAFGRCLNPPGGKTISFQEPGVTASTDARLPSPGTVQREALNADHAIFATRRSSLSRLNGFDPRFQSQLGILDYCLRLNTLGSRIVYTPFCYNLADEGGALELCEPQELGEFFARWGPRMEMDPVLQSLFNLTAAGPPRSEVKWWFDAFSVSNPLPR
jgi:hypothetical protein